MLFTFSINGNLFTVSAATRGELFLKASDVLGDFLAEYSKTWTACMLTVRNEFTRKMFGVNRLHLNSLENFLEVVEEAVATL